MIPLKTRQVFNSKQNLKTNLTRRALEITNLALCLRLFRNRPTLMNTALSPTCLNFLRFAYEFSAAVADLVYHEYIVFLLSFPISLSNLARDHGQLCLVIVAPACLPNLDQVRPAVFTLTGVIRFGKALAVVQFKAHSCCRRGCTAISKITRLPWSDRIKRVRIPRINSET